ncbi:MAG TPA: NAD-glutamate dehydrogenase domain-containing protein, partial [Acidimicrobiales bacterium]|nr:NAD-glutamate dehydrogenase domain-containing protein [Acidimicrobiales bacterium]
MLAGADDPWAREAATLLGDPDEVAAWADRLPPGYRDRTTPAEFVDDLRAVAALERAGPGQGDASRSAAGRAGTLGVRYNLRLRAAEAGDLAAIRLRRAGLEPVELTAVLPVLESFGMTVTEAVPQHVPAVDGRTGVHFDDFGLRAAAPVAFDVGRDGARLLEAVTATGGGLSDVDELNGLVVAAGLDWRQVVVVRAMRRFRRQAGVAQPDAELDAALLRWPAATAAVVAYLEARLAGSAPAADPDRLRAVAAARALLLDELAPVDQLGDDQALRGFLAVADAVVRTNWYASGPEGLPDTIALKVDSGRVAELPLPRPHVEAFVHGPTVEGVHLRMGPIARGGIRWSDRPGDFRTEVLALAEAQTKKNAIIVPTGAKGGFVVRGGRDADPDAALAAYRRYITALLELTDDVVAGEVVHPAGVVATDGDDPYLVVAADKGTATYSDHANAISEARGFWLGDAFASGGSHGYDHKAL